MSLSRIYLENNLYIDGCVELPAATSHYVKNVLRLKTDQQIILFNGEQSAEFTARIGIHGKRVNAYIISRTEKQLESPLQTTLLQAIGKPEHVDFIIQKATELGISHFCLFNSQRTQTHLKAARLEKKMAHWRGIVISACEQCGRNVLPTLSFTPTFQGCLQSIKHSNKILLDFEGKSVNALTRELDPELMFSMLVGPEGGLSAEEIELAHNANFQSCTLGPRVLRMETAAISILNIIQHHFGDMQ